MSIVFAILLFSFLIFIHELGHFVAAKLSGVRVNEFAIFMGPAIVKWQRGETQYSIRCIPIGGYCAMEGEDKESEDPRSFQKASWWKRLIILVAGSAMNFISGLLLFTVIFAPFQQLNVPVIGYVESGCTIVREDGLHAGDEFLKIDGVAIHTGSDFDLAMMINPGDVHDIVVNRNGEKVFLDDFKMEKHLFPGEEQERYGFSYKLVEGNFKNTVEYVWDNAMSVIGNVRWSLQMLLTGQAGLKDMAGPVGIVQIMSDTAQASETAKDAIVNMLYFGAFIAVNLAVMNLLPLPALDGGRTVCLLLTTLVEAITRKKIDPKYEGYLHGAGMVLLLALMAVILFKDIFFIFKG